MEPIHAVEEEAVHWIGPAAVATGVPSTRIRRPLAALTVAATWAQVPFASAAAAVALVVEAPLPRVSKKIDPSSSTNRRTPGPGHSASRSLYNTARVRPPNAAPALRT